MKGDFFWTKKNSIGLKDSFLRENFKQIIDGVHSN